MRVLLSYPWALAYGLYFYFLFQVVYLARFGSLNMTMSWGDLALYVVGVGSVLLCQYFSRKLIGWRQWLMAVSFLLALPFAFSGALGGGLLGWFGVVILGLIPFCVALPLSYWLIKRSAIVPNPKQQ
ncbi:MAG: hypothetical protein KGI73_01195 [Patescibacteria group bacterium]|nr:hypothetical protein [Patescibacteria group bacterium]